MFIGSSYVKQDRTISHHQDMSILGFDRIQIRERVLSRTETRNREDEEGETVVVTTYFYTLNCLVDGSETAEIDDDDLQAEIISGIYVLAAAEKPTLVPS